MQQSTALNSTKAVPLPLYKKKWKITDTSFNALFVKVAWNHKGKHYIERLIKKALYQANVKQLKGQTTLHEGLIKPN